MNFAGGEGRNCLNTTLFRKKRESNCGKVPTQPIMSLSNKNHFKPENLPHVMY